MALKKKLHEAILFLIWWCSVILVASVRVEHEFNINEKPEHVQPFEQWMKKHGKHYAQPEHKAHAYANFMKNVEYINKWNANRKKGAHVLGLNIMADLSIEEFNQKYLRKIHQRKRNGREEEKKDATIINKEHGSCKPPPYLDWSKQGVVTGVKSQACGDCWAFAATGAMESINAIKNGELISLSEQELTDCVHKECGCDGGYMEAAFVWVLLNGGINSESGYPYTGKKEICGLTQVENKKVKIDGVEYVERTNEAMLCAVLQQPIGISIATNTEDFSLYSGGIYDGECSPYPYDIDHQALLVGYGSEKGVDYWIIKNSWSSQWGEAGYMRLKRDRSLPFGKCGILWEASYPTIKNETYHFHYTSASHKSSFAAIFSLAFFLVILLILLL